MEHIWTMLMHKILQNHLLCAFVANLKIDAIYALYPESFCDKNLAIWKVFAFCDSELCIVYGVAYTTGHTIALLPAIVPMDTHRKSQNTKNTVQNKFFIS